MSWRIRTSLVGAVAALVLALATCDAQRSPVPSRPVTSTPPWATTPSAGGSLAPSILPSASPLPSAVGLGPNATWSQLARVPAVGFAMRIERLVSFTAGYVALSGSGDWSADGPGPLAWFSADGRSWSAAPLALLVPNCPNWGPDGDELRWDATPRAIATSGAEVVIVGEVLDCASEATGPLHPISWHSFDGRTWQRSEPMAAAAGDLRASVVWSEQGGWRALSERASWVSSDGLTWQASTAWRLDKATSARDGTVLAVGTDSAVGAITLVVSRDGSVWSEVEAPSACSADLVVPPSAPGLDAWVLAGRGGLCTSSDLRTWTQTALDAEVFGAAPTRYGTIILGDSCYGIGATCAPDLRALINAGDGWRPIAPQTVPFSWALADGPSGVLFIGNPTADAGDWTVWRLGP